MVWSYFARGDEVLRLEARREDATGDYILAGLELMAARGVNAFTIPAPFGAVWCASNYASTMNNGFVPGLLS
jgi:hypothetical protein